MASEQNTCSTDQQERTLPETECNSKEISVTNGMDCKDEGNNNIDDKYDLQDNDRNTDLHNYTIPCPMSDEQPESLWVSVSSGGLHGHSNEDDEVTKNTPGAEAQESEENLVVKQHER